MKTSAKVAIGIAAAVILIWGGIQIRQSMACSDLEEDYLNIVSNLKTTAQTQTLLGQLGKPTDDFDAILKINEGRLSTTLTEIYQKCGKRAAETASRKANELMFR